MLSLGFSEILVIAAVALIFIGPDKLPEVAQKLGRIIWQIKNSSEELRKELTIPGYSESKEKIKSELNELKTEILEEDNKKT